MAGNSSTPNAQTFLKPLDKNKKSGAGTGASPAPTASQQPPTLTPPVADLGTGKNPYDNTGAFKNTIVGAGAGYGGSLVDAFANLNRQMSANMLSTMSKSAQNSSLTKQTVNDLQAGIKGEDKVGQTLKKAGDNLNTQSQLRIQSAKTKANSSMGKVGEALVDIGVQGVNMAGDALLSLIPGVGSGAVMASRVYGNATREALESGADINAASLAGVVSATVETLTEKMFDGVAGVYGAGAADEVVDFVTGKLAKTDTGRKAWQILFSQLGEGAEEFVSGVFEPITKSIYNGKSYKENWSGWGDIFYSALIGSVMGTFGGAVDVVRGADTPTAFFQTAAQEGLSLKESLQAWSDVCDTIDMDSFNRKEGAELATGLAKVYASTPNTLGAELLGTESGYKGTKESARKAGFVLNKILAGENISKKEMGYIDLNDPAMHAWFQKHTGLSKMAKAGDIRPSARDAYIKTAIANANAMKRLNKAAADTARQTAELAENKARAEGARMSAEARNAPIDITNMTDDEVMLMVKKRSGVEAIKTYPQFVQDYYAEHKDELDKLSDEEAFKRVGTAWFNALKAQGLSDTEIDALTALTDRQNSEGVMSNAPAYVPDEIRTFAESLGNFSEDVIGVWQMAKGKDPQQFINAFRSAYELGRAGLPIEYVRNASSASYLTNAQQDAVHAMGLTKSDMNATRRANALPKGNATERNVGTLSAMNMELGEFVKSLNKHQRTAVDALYYLAQVTGLDIVLYQSTVDAEGNYQGEQGKFTWADDKIYIDVNAGLVNITDAKSMGKYTMLQTFSHEFTHFLEKWAPEEYNELRRAVFEEMQSRGVDIDALIENNRAKGMSKERAAREVVAQSMVDILPDSRFIQTLASKHESLFATMKAELSKFLGKLTAFFKKSKTQTAEAEALKESLHYAESIVKLFDKASTNALERYQNAQNAPVKAVASDTGVDTAKEGNDTTKTETPVATQETAGTASEEATEVTAEETTKEEAEVAEAAIEESVKEEAEEQAFAKPETPVEEVKADRGTDTTAEEKNEEAPAKKPKTEPKTKPKTKAQKILDNAKEAQEEKKGVAKAETVQGGTKARVWDTAFGVMVPAFDEKRLSVYDLAREFGMEDAPLGDVLEAIAKLDLSEDEVGIVNDFFTKLLDIAEDKDGVQELWMAFAETIGKHRDAQTQVQSESKSEAKTKAQKILDNAKDARKEKSGQNGQETPSGKFVDIKIVNVENTPNNNKEDMTNGKERTEQEGASTVDGFGSGASRLLEGLQAGDVQGNGGGWQSVPDAETQGGEIGEHGDSTHAGERPEGLRSTGIRQSGDLQLNSPDESQEQGKAESQPTKDENATPDTSDEASPETPLKKAVSQKVEQSSKAKPKGENFIITDSLDLPRGEKARIRANIEAIKLLRTLETEKRYATHEEQIILSKYVGWGGLSHAFGKVSPNTETGAVEFVAFDGFEAEFEELKSILSEEEYEQAINSMNTAYFTDPAIIRAMYKGLQHLGFKGGRILEPSAGVGNFAGAMPVAMRDGVTSFSMVELDPISGKIAKYLYPNNDVRVQGFEQAVYPDNYMDVVIGNVPFGNIGISDSKYPRAITKAIHNYFFAKALDKTRPGGIVMLITSRYTMDNKDTSVREYIAERADLIGAIRLPNTAFKSNAGTEVVSDILILKKRPPKTPYNGISFLKTHYKNTWGGRKVGNVEYFINECFDGAWGGSNGCAVLGKVEGTSGPNGRPDITWNALEGDIPLEERVTKVLGQIRSRMNYDYKPTAQELNKAVVQQKAKKRSLTVKDDKVFYLDEDGNVAEEIEEGAKNLPKIKALAKIVKAYNDLINAIQMWRSEEEIAKLRGALNKVYDDYVVRYGYLNRTANKSIVRLFPERYSLFSLEKYTPANKAKGIAESSSKSDLFTSDTFNYNREPTHAPDVKSALSISVNARDGVDIDYMAFLLGRKAEDVKQELLETDLAFLDATGETFIPAGQYLSGNVRAKLREAEGLAVTNPVYQRNVEALKQVIPDDISFEEIFKQIGATWIPTEFYEDFIGNLLYGDNYNRDERVVSVTYQPASASYSVTASSYIHGAHAKNTATWGTQYKNRDFISIMERLLNKGDLKVTVSDGMGHISVDYTATAEVEDKAEKIKEAFETWIGEDEERKQYIQYLYNEIFNANVAPSYDGSALTINGMNAEYTLREHQANAVQRIISHGGNTLLAHRVGAGKTFEMIASAMKLKELGICKKPMFVVPNSIVGQWGNDFKKFFPAANILVVGDDDLSKELRRVTLNLIANNNYDAIIIADSKFKSIPVSNEREAQYYEQQIDEVVHAYEIEKANKGMRSSSLRDLKRKEDNLKKKLDAVKNKSADKELGVTFEELGVDALFVDEAHNYKNLFYTTHMHNVSGLGSQNGSQQSLDLYLKTQYLQELNGGRGIVFATATPVMNSMVEMYTMQRYLQPQTLENLGISNFDAWASTFGEVVNALEVNATGSGYQVKSAFSRFKNVSALQQLFRDFADVVTTLPSGDVKIPKMKTGEVITVQCEPGEAQKQLIAELVKRSQNMSAEDKRKAGMLNITREAKMVSYSAKMMDNTQAYEADGKIIKCCKNVFDVWNETKERKGTQLIFCNSGVPNSNAKQGAPLYEDMKQMLLDMGIPANEIAFRHEADTQSKKNDQEEAVNEGRIRVLIGSDDTMSVGLNVQSKAVAIHHLDAPWRPGDIEQRDGRVFRQGNENEEVAKYVYVTVGSFDARLWNILERKQYFINQIMNGENVGNTVEDVGEVTLSAAEIKAIASGNPIIAEQVELEKKLKNLTALYSAHQRSVATAKALSASIQRNIDAHSRACDNMRKDLGARTDTYSEKTFSITLNGKEYTNPKEAAPMLFSLARKNGKLGEAVSIGKFAGLDLVAQIFPAETADSNPSLQVGLSGAGQYWVNTYENNIPYGLRALRDKANSLDTELEENEQALAGLKANLTEYKALANKPFNKEQELKDTRKRYEEIMRELMPSENNVYEDVEVGNDTVQHQARTPSAEPPKTNSRAEALIANLRGNPREEYAGERSLRQKLSRLERESARFSALAALSSAEDEINHGEEKGAHPINPKSLAGAKAEFGREAVHIPKDYNGHLTSKSVSTIVNCGVTPDELVRGVQKALEGGMYSYDAYTDAEAKANAEARLEDKGWTDAYNHWLFDSDAGVHTKDHSTMGWVLYNSAVSSGDYLTAMDIFNTIQANARDSAQALQAQNMINKLTPQGRLYMVLRSIDSLKRDLEKSLGNNYRGLEIDEQLMQSYYEALSSGDEIAIDNAWDILADDIASQLPVSWKEGMKAWRYLAMLGNPRTHIRNIAGNALFLPLVQAKNAIGAGLEIIVGGERTKSVLTPADAGLLSACMDDYANVEKIVRLNGKEQVKTGNDILDRRKIFGDGIFEQGRRKAFDALEAEDAVFLKLNYALALAGYLKANGVSEDGFTIGSASPILLEQARDYAITEARRATYRDMNAFSTFVSKIGKYQGDNPFMKFAAGVGNAIMPFTITPANILARAYQYSPAGLISVFKNAESKGWTAAETMDSLASSLTGTGLVALGILMAKLGVVSAGKNDDDKEEAFENLQGKQNYALNLPNGKSITLDWLAPESLPFFVGVQVRSLINAEKKNNKDYTMQDYMQALFSLATPILETSMLSSVKDLFEAAKYLNNPIEIVETVAFNYASQFIPTLFGQLERIVEKNRQETYRYNQSGILNSGGQYNVASLLNKLPGDYNQIDYVDAWGRKQDNGNVAQRIMNNLFNPAYVRQDGSTSADEELQRLYNAGFTSVLPQRLAQGTKINLYKDKKMVESVIPTASEYERYNTTKGQTQYRLVQTFVGSTQYKKLTDEERAEVLKDIYSYATSAANQELAQKRGYESNMESWMKNAKDGAGVLQSAVFRATMGEDKSKTNAIRTAGSLGYQRSTVDKLLKVQLSNSDYALYSALANVGMNANAIADFFIEADTNSNGSFTQDEMRAMLSNYRRNDATSIWNAYATARNWKSGY